MMSGLVGVPLGTILGTTLIKRFPRAHPIICGIGLLLSAPAMCLAMLLAEYSSYATFIFMFVAELALNLNWALVADMSLVRDALTRFRLALDLDFFFVLFQCQWRFEVITRKIFILVFVVPYDCFV